MDVDLLGWVVVAFWSAFRVTSWVVSGRPALMLAGAVALISALPIVSGLMVAVLAPFGLLLPALAIRDVLGRTGLRVERFHPLEILLALAALTLFIASSIGVFPFDPYRLGYGVLVPAIVSLCLVMWAVLRHHWLILIAILAAQTLWVWGVYGNNFFDHLFHALIVPCCAIWLVSWAVKSVWGRRYAPA
jgi:hypothetical protein